MSFQKCNSEELDLAAQLGTQFGSTNKAFAFVWSGPIQHNNMAIIHTGESTHL